MTGKRKNPDSFKKQNLDGKMEEYGQRNIICNVGGSSWSDQNWKNRELAI